MKFAAHSVLVEPARPNPAPESAWESGRVLRALPSNPPIGADLRIEEKRYVHQWLRLKTPPDPLDRNGCGVSARPSAEETRHA